MLGRQAGRQVVTVFNLRQASESYEHIADEDFLCALHVCGRAPGLVQAAKCRDQNLSPVYVCMGF